MNTLYGYLTSTEFRMQIEAIVKGFTQMQGDLDSEKCEKQISKVLDNTVEDAWIHSRDCWLKYIKHKVFRVSINK